MITRMDKDVGRIIDLLTSLDLDKDTIVFFCSDNGGISVVLTLFGEVQQEVRERFMYWEGPKNELQQAVRWQDWKAFREKPGAKLELYNLAVIAFSCLSRARDCSLISGRIRAHGSRTNLLCATVLD